MQIATEKLNSSTIISLNGRFDAQVSPAFKEQLESLIAAGEIHYVVDLSGVSYLDSAGIGCLVSVLRRVRERDGDMKMAAMNDKIRRVFELTRIHRIFDIYDDPEAAATSFS